MNKTGVILFFDSGIGGLTTLYECYKLLPTEKYVYYADEENMPYGEQDKNVLSYKIIAKLVLLIKQYQPNVVVIACNTATTLVVSKMRELYPTIVFVGTEPALVPALKDGKRHILLMATQNTITNSRLLKLMSEYFDILSFAPENLAFFIENNLEDKKALTLKLKQDLTRFIGKCDCVVLGCTHYVFCKKEIAQILGVCTYDGNWGVANRLNNLLTMFNLHSCEGYVKFANKGQIYTRLINIFVMLQRGQ